MGKVYGSPLSPQASLTGVHQDQTLEREAKHTNFIFFFLEGLRTTGQEGEGR